LQGGGTAAPGAPAPSDRVAALRRSAERLDVPGAPTLDARGAALRRRAEALRAAPL
jgi:hypothetical protein